MIVLGFDTATSATAVGLSTAAGRAVEARDDPGPGERPTHATRLLGLAEGLLAGAGLDWGDVQRIAVGIGPGTFTGLRIGVATARALAQSTGAELTAVSTLETLAAAPGPCADAPRRVLAVIDARRGEVYVAAYLVSAREAAGADGPGREPPGGGLVRPRPLSRPRAIAPDRLRGLLDGEAAWVAVGDGAIRFREHLESAQVAIPPDQSPLHRVDARVLTWLGATGPGVEPSKLVPEYLRVPDADLANR